MGKRPTRTKIAEQDFAILEAVAAAGFRCPQTGPRGPLHHNYTIKLLAHQGRIRVDVYGRNYRVVTILTGPHAGKSTLAPPKTAGKPYLVMDKNGTHRDSKPRRLAKATRAQPSAPSRPQPSAPRPLRPDEWR